MITEKQFAEQIEDLLMIFGWRFYHVVEQSHYARRTSKGFPDYVAVRPPKLLFIELKSDVGVLTPEQSEWQALLGLCRRASKPFSFGVYLWRPSMIEQITKILK